MRQTTLSVALEAKPESADRLSDLIDELHDRFRGANANYADFMMGVPVVHFLSMSVFPGADYDPLFVLEANFDGSAGVFWGQIEAAIGGDLRAMLRCCKRPLDRDGPLFDAVTASDSRAPVAPYFEVRTLTPSVFHHGNRGLTRNQILQEARLFGAIRDEIARANAAGSSPYRGISPSEIHAKLRTAMLSQFTWLDQPAPVRIPVAERIGDVMRLLLFVTAVAFVLCVPGMILAAVMSTGRFLVLLAVVCVPIAGGLYRLHDPLPGTDTKGKVNLLTLLNPLRLAVLLLFGFVIVAPSAFLLCRLFTKVTPQEALQAAARASLLGLLGMALAIVPGLLLWLRWLERRDASHDAPPINEDVMRQMAQREDWIPQNHMGSAVLIRPGLLRAVIIRVGHLGLGLFLRVVATDGYLGSMRTVHFAHWAFANNCSRLMFFSNFDQSWESYLDDFIEKAHEGLTLAWGSGVGFPPTRFLIQDGASHGRKFKAWARHSMAVCRFWYSAYSELTVDQIERNYRIAGGLRSKSLSAREAAEWLTDL